MSGEQVIGVLVVAAGFEALHALVDVVFYVVGVERVLAMVAGATLLNLLIFVRRRVRRAGGVEGDEGEVRVL